MMKIGVLSDTHLTDIGACNALAVYLLAGPFKQVDAILHAGDVVTADLDGCFWPLPWYSVRGNMDQALTAVPISRVVQFGTKRIGLIHGWGGPDDLERRVIATFAAQRLDVLVYGHSHQPVCHWIDSLLVMNPGSATDRRRAQQHTVGILTIEEQISGEIIVVNP